jgi:hypothetical protein
MIAARTPSAAAEARANNSKREEEQVTGVVTIGGGPLVLQRATGVS